MGKENLDILTEKYIFFPDFHPLRFSCFVAQEDGIFLFLITDSQNTCPPPLLCTSPPHTGFSCFCLLLFTPLELLYTYPQITKSIPLLTETGTKHSKQHNEFFICFVIDKEKLKGDRQRQHMRKKQ